MRICSSSGVFNIEKFSISYEKSVWYEYFKCGIQGIRDKFPDIKLKGTTKIFCTFVEIIMSCFFPVSGMKVLIDGTIPRSAGLSSSSALVVCSALTTTLSNGININKVDICSHLFVLLLLKRTHFQLNRLISLNFALNVRNTLVHKEVLD